MITENQETSDVLHKFHFLNAPVRGIWVRLANVWRDACRHNDYPRPVMELLGQMMAVTTMVANNLREEPSLMLQAVGSGPVKLAFAECKEHKFIRSIARIDEDHPERVYGKHSFKDLVGDGKLALTVILKNGSSYQGMVAMDSDSLLINLESYFETSEQLATRLKVVANEDSVTGCLLQLLPSQTENYELDEVVDQTHWERITKRLNESDDEQLASQKTTQYLRGMYPREEIYLDNPIQLSFRCSCSRERSEGTLRTLSQAELEEMLTSDNLVTVSCEFCGKTYDFDRMSLRGVIPNGVN